MPTTLDHPLTRRNFIVGGVAASALGLGLSACGSSSARSASSATSRQVSSIHGPVEVPLHPTRVVTTDSFSMATLFDIGFDPVGVYSAGAEYVEPQYLSRWKSIPKISAGTVGGAVDVEKVAALHPDLILGIDASNPPYSQLKQIAPTIIMPFSAAQVPWSAMATDTANAVNKKAALATLEHRYLQRAAGIRTTYADVLARTRWDVLQGGFDQGQYWLYGPKSGIGRILALAGIRFASGSASVASAAGQTSVSYEDINKLAGADALFYYATNAGQPANYGPQLFSQSLFKELAAVKADHLYGTVYFLPSGYGDAIGALAALEAALKKLQG